MGLRIDLPTLRERGNDIILLAKTFAVDFCKENGMPKKDFSPAALEKLMKYNYPGNVRELKSIAEIAVVMSEGNQIQADDVQFNQRHMVEDFLQEELTLEEYNTRIIKWYLI
jgi:DNA-binding NtrC family response regulator